MGLPANRQSGLTVLYQGLKAYFVGNGYPTAIHFGVRAYWEQWNQGPGGGDRVVVIAGEFHGERDYRPRPYGSLQPKLGHQYAPGPNREVAQWTRPITISVWAAPDLTDPMGELRQNEMTETLLEAVRAGAQTVAAADLVWGAIERVSPPQERAFGEALLVHIEQRGPLLYPTLEQAFPTAAVARGTVS